MEIIWLVVRENWLGQSHLRTAGYFRKVSKFLPALGHSPVAQQSISKQYTFMGGTVSMI